MRDMNPSRHLLAALVAALLAAPAVQAQAQTQAHTPAPGAARARPANTPVVTAPADVHPQKPGKPTPAARATPGAAAAGKPATEPPEAAAKPGEPPKGSVTGLPLPRWASLRSDDVNLRTGPGTRYPIEWVYHRRDLPVQIEREFEVWRLVADQEGVKGWVHQATLTGRRSFVAWGGERVIRRSAADDSAAVARLQAGVVGRLRTCDATASWCEVQVGEYRGFLRRSEIYGTYPGEAVN
jgi:SH3-like domain-containing protein